MNDTSTMQSTAASKSRLLKNRYLFGLGTIGRDMLYGIMSFQLVFYLTEVVKISAQSLVYVTTIIMCMTIFDAFNDPFMGVVVDNTRSRWGKFKPWILIGTILAGCAVALIYSDFGLTGTPYIISFAIFYLMWGITFTINDISYWSMLPSLSSDQRERERIGAFARICANIGLFSFVVGVVPITQAISTMLGGNLRLAYTIFALSLIAIMWFFQAFTLLGVKEDRSIPLGDTTSIKELFSVITKNDQLLWVTISMALFYTGYTITTAFGLYFFKYIYGDESMFSLFAAILGLSQLFALIIYPMIAKRLNRRQFYSFAIVLVVLGYAIFYLAPTNTMLFIGLGGFLLFVGQGFIQLLVLMFITDTVEYGELKLGRRNDSVTLSIRPFISKLSSAISTGVVGTTLLISGIKEAESAAHVTARGAQIFKLSMLVLPVVLILIGYIIYRSKYIIDEKRYKEMLAELEERRSARS